MNNKRLDEDYLVIRYFECVGVVVSILELAANKAAGNETTRLKNLEKIHVRDNYKGLKSIMFRFRNKLVHNNLDFEGINTIAKGSNINSERLAEFMHDLVLYLNYNISFKSLYTHCSYMFKYIDKRLEDNVE